MFYEGKKVCTPYDGLSSRRDNEDLKSEVP